ncbi:MerR family transcriptional regulator [Plantactinospora sonchi]|uniref:MerR family transcriptional regulator n=1 Tax=Plantactinospora sonchi TaxID=1544735 RepID=A0ABU7RUZ1_9ACTN
MRIGELAAMVGVSTRTVRHYHHLGLLPEPERLGNGYREYRLRDAVLLARIRRLAELGLSLDEIRDILADAQGRELREVLEELDADLARQQAAITARRNRLAALLAEAELDVDSTVPPELAAVLRTLPQGDSPIARLDRDLLTLAGDGPTGSTVAGAGSSSAARAGYAELFGPLATPEAAARAAAHYARLDELADAAPGDPRVAVLADEVAGELATRLPTELLSTLLTEVDDAGAEQWLAMMSTELSPAQAEVVRLLMRRLRGRLTDPDRLPPAPEPGPRSEPGPEPRPESGPRPAPGLAASGLDGRQPARRYREPS